MNMLRSSALGAIFLSLLFLLSGCEDNEIRPSEPEDPAAFTAPEDGQSLQSFISNNNLVEQLDSLIACAFSGDHAFLPEDLGADVRILSFSYFQEGEFIYFHSTDRVSASGDLDHYTFRRPLGAGSVAEGFFEVLPMIQPAAGTFERMIVARVIGRTIYLSNPIFMRGADELTAAFPDALAIENEAQGTPTFTWPETPGNNAIFFQLLTQSDGQVVSATYTIDPEFTYYQPDNVVLNVSPGTPPAALPATGGPHRMTVMGVGDDNWVNFIRDTDF